MQAANDLRRTDEEERLRAQEAARAAELQAAAERQIERAREVRIQAEAAAAQFQAEAARAAQLQEAAERQAAERARLRREAEPSPEPDPAAFASEVPVGPLLAQQQANALSRLLGYLNDDDWGQAERMIRLAPPELKPALRQKLSERFEEYKSKNEDTDQEGVERVAEIIADQSLQAARYLNQLIP